MHALRCARFIYIYRVGRARRGGGRLAYSIATRLDQVRTNPRGDAVRWAGRGAGAAAEQGALLHRSKATAARRPCHCHPAPDQQGAATSQLHCYLTAAPSLRLLSIYNDLI